MGLLSAGAFVRWGFCPLGLLSYTRNIQYKTIASREMKDLLLSILLLKHEIYSYDGIWGWGGGGMLILSFLPKTSGFECLNSRLPITKKIEESSKLVPVYKSQ